MDLGRIKNEVRQYKKKNAIMIMCLIVSIMLTMISTLLQSTLLLVLSITGFFVLLITIIINSVSGRFVLEDKIFVKCILPVLEESFDEFKYDNGDSIDYNLVKSLGIIDAADRIDTTSKFEGRYRNVPFVCNGLLTQERRKNSDGDTYYVDRFKGRFIIIGISILNDEGYVDILDSSYHFHYNNKKTKKATLSHEIEKNFDIFVTGASSLPMAFLDYLLKLKNNNPYYAFNVRVCKDRIYMFIDNINMKAYDLVGDLINITQKDIEFIIKKDSSFITNTISCILDGKEMNSFER